MKVLLKIKYRGITLEVVNGDITDENTEAIVNAANNSLVHGGGVAGAIVKKGGRIIQEESDKLGYVPTGHAVYTSAGRLKARYIIHTVGPIWGKGNEERKLRDAIDSSLSLADRLKLKSIAIPAISTGVFKYPKEKAIPIIVGEVIDYLSNHRTGLEEIHFTDMDYKKSELFCKSLESLKKV